MKSELHRLSFAEKQQVIRRLAEEMEGQKEVAFAYLYGSFIEDSPFHDIDVGVYLSGIGQAEAFIIAVKLASRLSIALNLEVDVRVLDFAPISFIFQVICGQIVFERAPEVRMGIVENAIHQYLDIKPLLHRAMKEAFAS